MKCILLAAGVGNRLQPFTKKTPKPLLPIVNKPAILHNIELAKEVGVDNFYINLHYKPKMIMDYLNTIDIRYSYKIEEKLSGPAGAITLFKEHFSRDEDILIMSADCLHRFDLSEMIHFHREKNSLLTFRLKQVSDPWNYGVIDTDNEGRILRFREKPSKSEVLQAQGDNHLVSCGIYILNSRVIENIPVKDTIDFVDLFNDINQVKKCAYGFTDSLESYWLDIGTPDKLLKGNLDFATGVHLAENSRVAENASLRGKVIVGENCVIGNNVKLEDVVLLNNTTITENMQINSSILEGEVKDEYMLHSSRLSPDYRRS